MSKSGSEQTMRKPCEGEKNEMKKNSEEELPMQSSPYLKYSNLEDYKRQAYGSEGHKEPVEVKGGGSGTDAPTLSGSGLPGVQAKVVNAVNRHSVP
ncbi:hypothetical protein QJS04_geneDACA001640 [Acorus gramineus]|uniref:Uncharacterized protein n=1 Tax=Acorus gramineus TaxID=55184 RepID=A0AAV9BHA0_ACOGR|nr:hypothetical protein QJS04_geneDACA001640 [Acorus gramineus]